MSKLKMFGIRGFITAACVMVTFFSNAQKDLVISGGNTVSSFVCENKTAFVWGSNAGGQLGLTPNPGAVVSTPTAVTVYSGVASPPDVKQINSGSGSHFVVLACTGDVWAWGVNGSGQVGNNTSGGVVTIPTRVIANTAVAVANRGAGNVLQNAAVVYAGTVNSFAILQDGKLVSWGSNSGGAAGQLGNGTTTDQSIANYVLTPSGTPLTGVIQIFAGDNVAYALVDPDGDGVGTVYSWGNGLNGTLGRDAAGTMNPASGGTVQDSYARPVYYANGTQMNNITQLQAGDVFGIALDVNGYVWTWGNGGWNNSTGNTTVNYTGSDPRKVIAGFTTGASNDGTYLLAKAIGGGQGYGMAVTIDGKPVAWGGGGCGDGGATGNGTVTGSKTGPQYIQRAGGIVDNNVTLINRGDLWGFYGTANNDFYAWGCNNVGQLGIGNTTDQAYATLITPPSGCSFRDPLPFANLNQPNLSVCASTFTSLALNSGFTPPSTNASSYTISWAKATTPTSTTYGAPLQSGPASVASNLTYTATTTGKYKVTVHYSGSNSGCVTYADAKDSVTITPYVQNYTIPTGLTFCGANINPYVNGLGNYNWYKASAGGASLATTQKNAKATIPVASLAAPSGTTYTVYVQETGQYVGNFAKKTPTNCGSVSQSDNYNNTNNIFTTSIASIVMDTAYMYVLNDGNTYSNIQVVIYGTKTNNGHVISDNTQILFTSAGQSITLPAANGNYSLLKIPLGYTLGAAGNYAIGPKGNSINGIKFANLGCAATGTTDDIATGGPYLTSTGSEVNGNWANTWGEVGNVVFHTPMGFCDRVPVTLTQSCPCTPPTSVTITPTTQTLCAGANLTITGTVTLSATPPTGAYQYTWYKGTFSVANIVAGPSATYSNYTKTGVVAADAGTYTLRVEDYTSPGGVAACYKEASMTLTVNPVLVPSVTAATPSTTICAGASITLTATPTNGGAAPTYQWSKGGTAIAGATNATYTTTAAANGDSYTVTLTSNATCASPTTATSTAIVMTVNPVLVPSVTAAVSPTGAICAGTSVTFTATPTNGGAAPAYQWKKGGTAIAGATNATYTTTTAANNDSYTVTLTSNATCASPTTATSTAIVMTVNPVLVPSVTTAVSPTGAICAGTSVTFTATPTNGGAGPTYQWKKGGTAIAGATNATYTTTTAANGDSYTVTLTSNATCASPTTATSTAIVMTVNPVLVPSVTAAVSPTGAICAGTSVTFTATPTNGGAGPTYQWSKGGTAIAGATNATYTTTGAANNDSYTVTLTSNATCVSPATATSTAIVMTVNPILPVSVSIATPATTICASTSVTFTATPTNGGTTPTYQWKKGGTNIAGATNATYTTTTVANNDSYTVVMTSNATCPSGSPATSNAIVMTVTTVVTPSVTISAAPSGAICAGTSVTFTANPGNGGSAPTYQWKKGGVAIAGETNLTYTSTTLANGDQISVDMVSNSGCASTPNASSTAITMTVNPIPTPSVSAAADKTTICPGATITFTATPTQGGTAPTYQWKKGGTAIAGATNATFVTTTAANGDVYTVSMVSNALCAPGTAVTSAGVTITVTPVPTISVTITADQTSICANNPVNYTATVSGTGSTPAPTYEWFITSSATAGSGTSQGAASTTATTFGTSALTATNNKVYVQVVSNASCAATTPVASNVVAVTVNAGITAGSIGSDQTICYNGTVAALTELTTSTAVTPSYVWEAGPGTSGPWTAIPGATNANYTPPAVGVTTDVYIHRIVNDGSAPAPCNTATSNIVHITVLPQLTAGTISADETVCSGAATTMMSSTAATGGTGTYTYQWQSNTTSAMGTYTNIAGATNATYSAGSLTTTTYYQLVYTSGTCGSATTTTPVTKTVTPNTTPTVTVNDPGQTCAGATMTFTATTGTAGTTPTYQWHGPVAGTNSNTYSYTASASDNGSSVTVTVTSSDLCNTGPVTSAPITLNIVGATTPTVTITTPTTAICVGMPVTYTATGTGTGGSPTYQWYQNGGMVGTNSTTYTSTTLASSTDQVWVSMTSSLACIAVGAPNPVLSNKVSVTVKPIPTPAITQTSAEICSSEGGFTFTSSGIGAGSNLQWQLNTKDISGATGSSYYASQAGDYTLVEDNGTCTVTSNPATLYVVQSPVAYAGADLYVTEGTFVQLQAGGGTTGTTYSWSPTTGLSSSTISNPSFKAENTTTYTVTLTNVGGASGTKVCTDQSSLTVVVVKPIVVPNVITVNGDGSNDTWKIQNIEGFPNATFEIFNRWGNLVWKSTGYPKQWDGTNFRNGEVLPDGTYFYIIDLHSPIFTDPYTGWIQIMK